MAVNKRKRRLVVVGGRRSALVVMGDVAAFVLVRAS
jgi:hypothetical protein